MFSIEKPLRSRLCCSAQQEQLTRRQKGLFLAASLPDRYKQPILTTSSLLFIITVRLITCAECFVDDLAEDFGRHDVAERTELLT